MKALVNAVCDSRPYSRPLTLLTPSARAVRYTVRHAVRHAVRYIARRAVRYIARRAARVNRATLPSTIARLLPLLFSVVRLITFVAVCGCVWLHVAAFTPAFPYLFIPCASPFPASWFPTVP